MEAGTLLAVISPLLAGLGVLIAWLTFRRGKRTAKINEALATVQIWESNNKALEARVRDLEATNNVQAKQLVELRADNKRLEELVTQAAAVKELIAVIQNQHREVIAAIRGGLD